MTDFSEELNPEQLAAATAPDGPLLALAAAGTGKTRTLVYRVAHLVNAGVPAERILLLTFTNRAAREMIERAREVAGPRVGNIWGGTFHHFANRLLRKHAALLEYPGDYAILDRDESGTLIKNCVKKLGLQSKDFPKAAVLLGLHSAAANTGQSLDDAIEARYAEHWRNPQDILGVLRAYDAKKREAGAMDFDDLLLNGLRLLREHSALERSYQERFLHILVDEYQDTNPIQAELVDRLAARNGNLLVVGDDFQCIYSWRGADHRNIMSFPERYPRTRIFKLETNYRSVPEILAVANACIAGNADQFRKVLRPTRETYRKPQVVHFSDGDRQADYVLEQIASLRREGYRLSDMAILYRAHYHALEAELALRRSAIPYFMTSGMRFFEQAHIKDACCILRLWRSRTDELAFQRVLQWLPGVGPKSAEKIWLKLGAAFDARRADVCEAVGALLPAAARSGWNRLATSWAGARQCAGEPDPARILNPFLTDFYENYAVNAFDNFEKRLEDIQGLIQYLAKYESIDEFLNEAALFTNMDAESDSLDENSADAVRLSTIHQAKGLEWPVVFVLWLAEGLFPSSRSLADTHNNGSDCEERRLFYVAITRAKDELRLCVPAMRVNRDGSANFFQPSRFIREIPPELVETSKLARPGFFAN
jgi:DNA helicase II / ATP-dependent DNA helicase PcrA